MISIGHSLGAQGPSPTNGSWVRAFYVVAVAGTVTLTGCAAPSDPPTIGLPRARFAASGSADTRLIIPASFGVLAATAKRRPLALDISAASPARPYPAKGLALETGSSLTILVDKPVPANKAPFIARRDTQNLMSLPRVSDMSPDRFVPPGPCPRWLYLRKEHEHAC